MAFWDNPAVVGVLGVLTGAASAYSQTALSSRAKAGEELRDRRLAVYPDLWLETSKLSFWPRAELTWADVKDLHLTFRRWYYTSGGLVLSERSRARYGEVQELISANLGQVKDLEEPVPPRTYDDLARTCSSLRSAMAEDLATRRQRSVAWALVRMRWHRQRSREAKRRIRAVGGGRPVTYPLTELHLPYAERGGEE